MQDSDDKNEDEIKKTEEEDNMMLRSFVSLNERVNFVLSGIKPSHVCKTSIFFEILT